MATGRITRTEIQGIIEPVSLSEARVYLGITLSTEDDDLVTDQISSSREIAETFLSRDLVGHTIVQTEIRNLDGVIDLYRSPIASVDSVSIDGVDLVLGEGYELRGSTDDPVVYLMDATSFADAPPTGPYQNVVITYTTSGFTNAVVKQGVLSIVSDLYNYGKVGKGHMSILTPYRKLFIG